MMGFIDSLLTRGRIVPPDRFRSSTNRWPSATPRAGIRVDQESALFYSALYAAVTIISETVASLPCKLFRGREVVTTNPAEIVSRRPNAEQSALHFFELMTGHLCLWGNAYAEIVPGAESGIVDLWPLRPDRMDVMRTRDTREIVYVYRSGEGQERHLPADRVLHVRLFGTDPLVGKSPITLARESLSLGLACEQYGAAFFGNGTKPGGVFQHPGKLTPDAHERLRESMERTHRGPDGWQKTIILEEGLKWETIGVPPEEAQFLETRKFQVIDVARWFRLPPHMLGDLTDANFSNMTAQDLNFYKRTLLPYLRRWETELDRKLLPQGDDRFFRFNADAVLRADIEKRMGVYKTAVLTGIWNRNECREKEDMAPYEGGDDFIVPMNMGAADKLGDEPEPPNMSPDAGGMGGDPIQPDEDEAERFRPIIRDAAGRLVHKETSTLRRVIGKAESRNDVDEAIRKAYRTLEVDFISAMGPALDAIGVDAVRAASQYVSRHRDELLEFVRRGVDVSDLVDDWKELEPDDLTDRLVAGD